MLRSINAIIASNGYLESADCSEALAAAEVIVASLSGDGSRIPKEALVWLNKKPEIFGKTPRVLKEHGDLAAQAIRKILASSVPKELWKFRGQSPIQYA